MTSAIQPAADASHAHAALSEKEWRHLLEAIADKRVIPILGPGVVTVAGAGEAAELPLYAAAAPRLAAELDLANADAFGSIHEVARAYLGRGGSRIELYNELRSILRGYDQPGAALRALAAISDFELYLVSTADALLARALATARRGFRADSQSFWFHPNGGNGNHPHEHADPNNPCDLPHRFEPPLVYHILGALECQDYAVWEEDYMEFVYGLIEKRDQLRRLFQRLGNANLLMIGAPSEDWVVRLLLRVARGKRLSDGSDRAYLADYADALPQAMTFFFERTSKLTRIIAGDPRAFAIELAQRWQAQRSETVPATGFFERMQEDCPTGAVFISYAREAPDVAAVETLGRALLDAGVPVWVDKRELRIGENYERALKHAVKNECSFFISLISPRSESSADRYVHKERAWAADRHIDGLIFYLPLLLDMPVGTAPRHEPEAVRQIERERFSPEALPGFVARVRDLYKQNRRSGRPRG